jgi:diacylglycerol O-acyltransferase / wax synthase
VVRVANGASVPVCVSGATSNRAADGTGGGEPLRLLSAEDLSILALETETVAGHTCKVIMLGDRIDVGRLRESIAGRLDRVPALQMRLAEADGDPCWELAPDVDLDAHVVLAEESGPVDAQRLRALTARLFEQRLDRSRPLWRIDVVPECEGGGSALVWRLHHAVADGQTFLSVAWDALWDEGLSGPPPGPGARDARRPVVVEPRAIDLPGAAGGRAAPSRAQSRHPLGPLGAAARQTPHPWHRSPFSGRIDAQREVAFASAPMEGMRRAARATEGATLNDAVLTVVAGGLRRWLESRHGRIGSVRIKVPVSLHEPAAHEDDSPADDPGNRDSFFCLDVPLAPADPLARMRTVRRATRVRKQGHDAEQLDALMRRLEHAPQLRSFAESVLAHPRSFALNVSNVRGPRRPVHVLGAPVRSLYSLAEIREHHALRIAVVSLAGTLSFGLTADPSLLGGVDRLAGEIQLEAAELVARVQYV